ncbi:MAG: four helix bundle protein [Planctomycetota bacterium]
MAGFERIEDIQAWQKSRTLTRDVFKLFQGTSLEREYTLKNQITRSTLSIMNNIAEGFGRYSDREFFRFLDIAKASGVETLSMLYVLLDLGKLTNDSFKDLYKRVDEVISMIAGLQRHLKQSMR